MSDNDTAPYFAPSRRELLDVLIKRVARERAARDKAIALLEENRPEAALNVLIRSRMGHDV